MQIVGLAGGRTASYEVIGSGRPALMFAGGPGFSAAYMNGDAQLLSDQLCSYLIDPHGSGSSTPPADPADYSPEGHARFYEQVRQALALAEVVVLGHSFGATTALTYAALFPRSTAACVAVAAFGIGPDADAEQGGDAEAEAEALLARHASSPWYEKARPVMDSWTERLLAAADAAEMEQMMATVLPFYLAEPDKPEVAARLAEMSRVMKANLAAGQSLGKRPVPIRGPTPAAGPHHKPHAHRGWGTVSIRKSCGRASLVPITPVVDRDLCCAEGDCACRRRGATRVGRAEVRPRARGALPVTVFRLARSSRRASR